MRPALVRATVLDVFERTHGQRELVDRALDRALRANASLHSTERRLISESAITMVRFVRRLDYVLDAALAASKLPARSTLATPEHNRLRLAFALATELGRSAQEAANLAGLEQRFVSAIERAKVTEPRWPDDPVEALAVRRSVPDWIARRLVEQYGAGAEALLAAMNERAPMTARANTLKATRDELIARLAEEQTPAAAGACSPWAARLEGRPNAFGLKAWKSGLFEVQDEGSQLIALATGAKAGMTVIDACAGGGGKTLALAAMMRNKGRLVACDVTESRLQDLAPRAKRAGVFCVQPLVVGAGPEGDDALRPLRHKADVVLVDAPCSGTGAWRRNPDARWRLDPSEIAAFAEKQRSIVRRYATCLKPGGLLVYATCSLLSEENDAVVDALIDEGVLEHDTITVPDAVRGERGRMRLLPSVHGTDGFFAAALRRPEKA